MRFATLAILTFVAYNGNQAIAASTVISSHARELQGQHYGRHNGSSGRHRHTQHPLPIVSDSVDEEDSVERDNESQAAKFHSLRQKSRQSYRRRHKKHHSEAHDEHDGQVIEPRSPVRIGIVTNLHQKRKLLDRIFERDLQDIEARSPHKMLASAYYNKQYQRRNLDALYARDIQDIYARSREIDDLD